MAEVKVIENINPVLNTGTIYKLSKFDNHVSIEITEKRGGGYTDKYYHNYDEWPDDFYARLWETN